MNNAIAHEDSASPFHEGEQRLQALTGRREKMEAVGRAFIRDHMPDQHRDFFAQLPFVVVGGLDAQRQPWATLWCGPPGFMHSPEPTTLRVMQPHHCIGDPLAAHWRDDTPIGLLGIEPHTRRRNRLNGTLRSAHDSGHAWDVHVRQSFGNCPKYIQPRLLSWAAPAPASQAPGHTLSHTPHRGTNALPDAARQCIARADTFFIASASPDTGLPGQRRCDGVDVSHRGGEPGFVHIVPSATQAGHDTLLIPDYSGNFMFNTLGNILLQPRIGLLFMDVARGDLLWLAGHGEVDMDSPQIADFVGAQRLLRVRVDAWIMASDALPLRCEAMP